LSVKKKEKKGKKGGERKAQTNERRKMWKLCPYV